MKINDEIVEKLRPLMDSLSKCGYKVVEEENLHITIRFYGEIGLKRLESLKEEYSSLTLKEFSIKIKGVGAFPSLSYPRVFFCRVHSMDLLKLIERFKGNDVPHLTLGRLKKTDYLNEIRKLLRKYENYEFGNVAVREILIMESVLKKEGPEYVPKYVRKI